MAPNCPFVNLPETRQSRWGEGLTVEDMKKCVWVRPELVAQIEFLEWTDGDHLRHANFSGLRDDKDLAQAIGQAVIGQGYRVIYREAHILLEGRWKGDAISAREPSESGRASKA